jgi:hypothetical protein
MSVLALAGLWACGPSVTTSGTTVALTRSGTTVALTRAVVQQSARPSTVDPVADAALITHAGLAHYRQWTRVNPTPVLFADPYAALCAATLTMQLRNVPNLHKDRYITVYVNSVGSKAMMTQLRPAFPVGSVIVKEKRSAANAPNVELMTVMVKREKGYNPQSGNWEYAVTDGTGTQVQASGKLSNCQTCHVKEQYTDYVFRTPYVPDRIMNQWK